MRSMTNSRTDRSLPAPVSNHPPTNFQLLDLYSTMVRARSLDERTWILSRQARTAFTITCQGHEAPQVGSAYAREPGRDLMLAFFARAADPARGGRPMPNRSRNRRLPARLVTLTTKGLASTSESSSAGYRKRKWQMIPFRVWFAMTRTI